MNGFNLMPWREQRRQSRLRSWRWGWAVSFVVTVSLVLGLDHAWDE